MKKFMQRKKKGFTLVELMVVVAIIAVLVLLAVPRLAGNSEKAKTKVFESNFRTLVSDVTMASTDTDVKTAVNDIRTKGASMVDRPEAGVKYEVGQVTVGSKKGYGVLATYGNYKLYFETLTGQTAVAGSAGREGASFKDQGTVGAAPVVVP